MVALGAGLDSLPDWLHAAMAVEANKPDSMYIRDLGSPVSSLHTATATHSRSSSSSSRSLFAKPLHNVGATSAATSEGCSHSDKLYGSSGTSPVAIDGHPRRPGHRPMGGARSSTLLAVAASSQNVLLVGTFVPRGRSGKLG